MKNIFKFAAMAFAAVVMFASCDKKDDKTPATVSIDGKQWSYAFNYGGMMETTAVLDLGVTNEGIGAIYMDMGGMYFPGFAGTYTITAKDGASGTISLTDPNDPSGSVVVFTYSNLTEKTVTLSCDGGAAWTMESTAAEAVEMSFDEEEVE